MPAISRLSIIPLLIEGRFDQTRLSTGTAFIAVAAGNRPVLITNRHNVTGRNNDTGVCLSSTGGVPNNLVVWHNARTGLGNWLAVRHELFRDDDPLWIEHPTLGARADFVALPVDPQPGIVVYPVELGTPNPDIFVGPADTVSVIGFPFGLSAGGRYAIWATGFMASEPELDQEGLPMFYIDCRGREGQSGSPVVAHRSGGWVTLKNGDRKSFNAEVWAFLGIYSGRINVQSDIGRVWKREAIGELVSAIR
jgi:Trypsin-like peptidase domain